MAVSSWSRTLVRWLHLPALLVLLCLTARPAPAQAQEPGIDHFGGREVLVYAPASLPPAGQRALVVVLHGGLGNADRIAGMTPGAAAEVGMNLDALADQHGFIVVYLNGTPVTRMLGDKFLGWNSGGGCCGVPAETNVDDVGYIAGAVKYLEGKYGVDPARVFGLGHSNGAMMTQRMLCESNVFAAGVAISGPLNLDVAKCPAAQGHRVLAIHGADDQNVPIKGGVGTKGFNKTPYQPEAHSQAVMTASGAAYTLDIVPGADHFLGNIDAAMQRTEGVTVGEKAAGFFGLLKP